MTDKYGVIGNPIAPSHSAALHAEFARRTGEHVEYDRIVAPAGSFSAAAAAFRAAHGAGLTVSAPFKLDAYAYACERSVRAELAGAVNALKFEGGRVIGDNFDGVGLTRDVTFNLRQPLQGRRVLMLGAGAAVRVALHSFLGEQPAELVIAHLQPAEVDALAQSGRRTVASDTLVRSSTYRALAGRTFDLIFNATSASLRTELPPLPATVFKGCSLAYDLVYGKGLTPFLRLAGNAGVPQLADGVGMRVENAAETFFWWRGVRPNTSGLIDKLQVGLS